MPFHHTRVVLLLSALVCGVFWDSPASAQAQSTPTLPMPPQQMSPYSVPATYPSTATPAAASLPASPYATAPAARMASVPNTTGVGDAASTGAAMSAAPSNPPPLYTPYGSPDAMAASTSLDSNYAEHTLIGDEPWTWQLLPTGLMYKPYLAGQREPRLAAQFVHERDWGWLMDVTIGARQGLLRYGTENDFWPQGWQLDVEAAAFPRVNLDEGRDLEAIDFRFGVPLTTRQGPWEFKFGYYHYCSHLGDEYMIKHPSHSRINYVRESLVSGLAVYLSPSLRLYSEAGYAFYTDEGAEPWEFQFGADFTSPEPTGARGAPFFAINGHLRQENDFGGNMTVQTGWQWRGRTGHLLRIGMQYFNGMSEQVQFYNRFEEQIGAGLWYDF